jgi:HK97 family phage major capsid protein
VREAPSFQAIKEAIDSQATAFESFKQTNDERLEALKNGDIVRARELDAKLEKIEKDVTTYGQIKKALETEQQIIRERVEELESRASSPGKTASAKRQGEYKAVFVDWMRNKGQSPMHEQQMYDIQRRMLEAKDITIGTGSAGGFAVPEEIAREIELQEKKFSPVRDLVKVVTVGTSDYKELVNIRGATSGWVGETGTRSATATPALREITPTHGELYAYPQVSEWSLDDIFFNVEAWLAENVGEEFAIQEGDAVIRGNGTTKPTGMINTTPTTVDDFGSPLRAAAVYQYIASSASPDAVTADSLIDVQYKLNSRYRAGAFYVFNSNTAGAIRKLKNTQGDYLWAPGLVPGQPNMLLGYPTASWEQMDDIGANTFPVAFGNFRRGYVLADRVGLRITRDSVTNIGHVRFYVRRREGGIVLNNDAIKFIRTT